MKKEELTPMMRQFMELKSKHPDALLLFRCGDFYETYSDDAIVASEILGITLTRRSSAIGTRKDAAVAMAGFPHHALDTYLPKLIRAGKRVAICDQLEDPKLTKKLVKRGITELVTPGVAMNDTVLHNKENNFLAAVHFGKAMCGISFLDLSTGEFLVYQGESGYVDKLLSNFSPKEVLYERGKRNTFLGQFGGKYYTYELDDWLFVEETSRKKLNKHFGVRNLKGFGVDHIGDGLVAAGVILYYLEQTQHTHLQHIRSISRIEESRYMHLDRFTVRSLELLSPMNEGGDSLLKVIDKTVTAMGGRLLLRWLSFPLKNVNAIRERQDVVDYFFRYPEVRDRIHELLQGIGDLERLSSKIATQRIGPREFIQLRQSLECVDPIKQLCGESDNPVMEGISSRLDSCEELISRIARDIRPDTPSMLNKGGVINDGVNEELDRLREIAYNGKDYLLQLQQREIEATGISSLKIGFNNVFGYYMEVRNTFKDKVPSNWIRKQTLVNAERYITEELKQYEESILGAEEKILILENSLYNQLMNDALAYISQIQQDASELACIDCLLSFALCAQEYGYVRPVVDDSLVIDIRQGRHPVIERNMPVGEQYVANDVLLDCNSQQIIILTGPNMAGKSALLRQTALITIMAQIGSFVPAESARIGYCDKVFTRVGASDNISLGESTFMVEMTEASNILNNLSERSLVLFDELGRGTSTYDGISIAWSIVEYIHENPKSHARTLFATHYHELNEMEKLFQRVKNYNVSVKEVDNQVIFLRKLERGGSEHSFGIHVAKIAGMVPSVVRRAEQVLTELERNNQGESIQRPKVEQISAPDPKSQLSFFQLDDPILTQVRDEIIHTDVDNLTPLEALNKLNDIKKILLG
ncbi:MAG: DNA mismatch repair protein MutS [Bacteroidaceae bacterium]|nr:DNA mismatch repair protein MutS [Bacteroidaceae bacterium]